ncbi:MAG: PRC-barrel domain-containing protein [Cyanobacteria bacterium J06635_10]
MTIDLGKSDMALFKIEDFNPNYRNSAFDGQEIKGLDVYAGRTNEKIGTIHNVLVDETGRFRYLVVDTGFWIFGKKVLLPVGRCYVDVNAERINATGLVSKEQAEKLPEYSDDMTVDYDYEERVRNIYRTPNVETSAPVEMTPPVEASGVSQFSQQISSNIDSQTTAYHSSNYTYDLEPEMYNMNDKAHQKLKLYEEKLVANKRRQYSYWSGKQ